MQMFFTKNSIVENFNSAFYQLIADSNKLQAQNQYLKLWATQFKIFAKLLLGLDLEARIKSF